MHNRTFTLSKEAVDNIINQYTITDAADKPQSVPVEEKITTVCFIRNIPPNGAKLLKYPNGTRLLIYKPSPFGEEKHDERDTHIWEKLVEVEEQVQNAKEVKKAKENEQEPLLKQDAEQAPIDQVGNSNSESKKAWEKIPDHLWDREVLKLWWNEYTCPEIKDKTHYASTNRIRNRLSELRKKYGEELIPKKEQIRKMKLGENCDIV